MNEKLGVVNTFTKTIITREKINDLIPYLNKHKQLINNKYDIKDGAKNDYTFRSAMDLIKKLYNAWNGTDFKGVETTKDKKNKVYQEYEIINNYFDGFESSSFKNRCSDIDYRTFRFSNDDDNDNEFDTDLLDLLN